MSPSDVITLFHTSMISALQKTNGDYYDLSDSLMIFSSATERDLNIKSQLREMLQSFRGIQPISTSSFNTCDEDDFL